MLFLYRYAYSILTSVLSLISVRGLNGYIARKTAALVQQQEQESVLHLKQTHVQQLVLATLKRNVFMKTNHARFKNVPLVQILRIIAITKSTPNAKIQF